MISIGISLAITLKIQKYLGFYVWHFTCTNRPSSCACEKLSVHGLDSFQHLPSSNIHKPSCSIGQKECSFPA